MTEYNKTDSQIISDKIYDKQEDKMPDKNNDLVPITKSDKNNTEYNNNELIPLKSMISDVSNSSYRNILKGFGIFSIINEVDVDDLRSLYPNIQKIIEFLNRRLELSTENIKHLTKLEIFGLLTVFCFENNFEVYEICSLFSIIWDILALNFQKNSKRRVFEIFKELIVKHSVDRPPFQVGIYKKESLEKISDFFINSIYSKFELLIYLTTDRKLIELTNSDIFNYNLPHTMDIEMGEETLPRQNKILKNYYENKRPKTELEQKIEMILDFERERLDKILQEKFHEQDEVFNKKVEELLSKKKK